MAETVYELTKFPNYIVEDFKSLWTTFLQEEGIEVSKNEMWKYKVPKDKSIYSHFPQANLIEYYKMAPGFFNSPHLDRGRWCAVNIPIENNPPYTDFFVGKYFHLAKYTEKPRRDPYYDKTTDLGPTGMFIYEEEKFEHNRFTNPLVFSTKVPHGGTNMRNTDYRVLATVTFGVKTYEQLINELPPEWF